jgi:4-diphosphocytidyl-2-C-methyl-D-erythritol kinase
MLVFPNCKINLGLNVVEKRPDGFHNIETVFYPINWCDALEVIENKKSVKDFELYFSGISIAGDLEQNLIFKAYKTIKAQFELPNIEVHLHKNIPMGAGLGGGSSDAAFFIQLLDAKFNLQLKEEYKLALANSIGSDCAFFIQNKPVYAREKGNVFSECKIDLSRFYILIVYPNIHSNTKEAYDGIVPKLSKENLKEIIENKPIDAWKNLVFNAFEVSIFKKYPLISELKNKLYQDGALYASLSGSGSAIFGIFYQKPELDFYNQYPYYLQSPR